MKSVYKCCLLIWVLFYSANLFADQVLVRNYDNKSLEIGQAYLTHDGDRCLAILPTHVVKEAGSIAAFLKEGEPARLGEAQVFHDLGDDVSVAIVSGGITEDCGYSASAVSRAVESRIEANALASIRSVNGDGTIAQLALTVIDNDGSMFLRVQPTNNTNQLRKGHSGSMLIAGGMPIGMLLAVDSRFGVGKVIRLDRMFAKLDSFIHGETTEADNVVPKLVNPVRPGSAAITSWSVMAIDSSHRATNLVNADDASSWLAFVEAWPVELEMALDEGRVAIAGLELDGSSVLNAGELPAEVEILISSVDQGRRWRSVESGKAEFINGIATFTLAPTWARHIKLIIRNVANGGNTVGLSKLRVIRSN